MDFCEQGRASPLLVVAPLVEEGTLTDLGDRGALLRLEGEQAHDQVLEVLGKVDAVHSLEVLVILLVLDHAVVLVLEDLGAVREFALYHDEKKDTHREKVDASTVILVVSQDLRSYVTR